MITDRMWKVILLALVWLVLVPGLTVWSVKHGSPQSVWFYCDMLGWCKR